MRCKFLCAFLLFSFFFISILADATITKGPEAVKLVKNIYGSNETIKGYLNISLKDEASNNNLTVKVSNVQVSSSLLDFLLTANLQAFFSCKPSSCKDTYETFGSSMKNKLLTKGEGIIVGVIKGSNIEFKSDALEFSITGYSNKASCGKSPLRIDILADNSIDWQYIQTDDFCGPIMPSICYNNTIADSNFDITNEPYCERISLPVSNKFKLAALTKKNKDGGDLTIFLYDKKTGNTAQCDLSEPSTPAYTEQSCVVDFTVGEEQDYYICIRDDLMNNAYAVKGEVIEPLCGMVGLPDTQEDTVADFALLAQPATIQPFNTTIRFNETEFARTHTSSVTKYIRDYMLEKYKNDCTEGCVIPIKITAESNLSISDFSLSYCVQRLCTTENNFYDAKKKPSLLSMNFTLLPIEILNFSLQQYGSYLLQFFIGNELLHSQNITIERVPVIENLTPLSPAAVVLTEFSVKAYSPKKNLIVKYEWDFGDGSRETTNSSRVEHLYANVGAFKLEVKVTDSEGLTTSRTFDVIVGTPKEFINATLKNKNAILKNITEQISGMPWYKQIFEQEIKISELENTIKDYGEKFKLAATDAEFIELMEKLKGLVMPLSVYEPESIETMPAISDVDAIMPEYIEKLNGGKYDVELSEETKNAIWNWQYENVDLSLSSKLISIKSEDNSTEDVITVFDLVLKPKQEIREMYLVMLLPFEKVKFQAEYGQQQVDDIVGFVFRDVQEQRISTAVAGKLNLEQLVMFASDYLGNLAVKPVPVVCNINGVCERGENWKNCRQDCQPIARIIFSILLVLIAAFLIYLFLQKWYATRYESHLFKDKQDLYNLMLFISNSFRKGMNEDDVREKLKKAGWKTEQIVYAINKVKGKPTGMPSVRVRFKKK